MTAAARNHEASDASRRDAGAGADRPMRQRQPLTLSPSRQAGAGQRARQTHSRGNAPGKHTAGPRASPARQPGRAPAQPDSHAARQGGRRTRIREGTRIA